MPCPTAYQSGFEMMVAIDVAVQRCVATRFSSSRLVRLSDLAFLENVPCKQANVSSMCIGNNHCRIMARRKPAGSARIDRTLSRIVRRMVVVLSANVPGKRASFAMRSVSDHQVTVMGEVPLAAVQTIADGVSRRARQ